VQLLRRLFAPPPRAPREPELSQLRAGPFDVTLTRKAVRTLRIRLGRDGEVLATAPWRMRDAPIIAFVLGQQAWIEKQRLRLAEEKAAAEKASGSWSALPPQARRALERQRRRELLAAAEALRPRWEAALGVKAERLTVRSMRSRWGSCNPRSKTVTLALALHGQEEALLELILVHELVHLRVRDHGPRFKALLSAQLPDHRQRWKRLKQALPAGPLLSA
jgi:predicted metal-dependent hydrolase